MNHRQWNGCIVHRFNFDTSTTTASDDGQKKRSPPGTPKAGNKRPRSQSPPQQIISKENGVRPQIGYFFVPELELDGRNGTDNQREYRVVSPHGLVQDVIDAARFRLKVTIANFAIVTNQGDVFIELHKNGIKLHGKYQAKSNCAYMSLEDFQAIETQMEMIGKTKSKFNIEGTVDCLSPIISALPDDPFAMFELYDDKICSLTAVVVLKGHNALICHPGIHPGSRIKLKNVIRRKWLVPQSLQAEGVPKRLHDRSPSHVFVITESNCIVWDDRVELNVDCKDDPAASVVLPSTIDTLTSVQGRILAVRHTSVSSKQNIDGKGSNRIVHYIILEPLMGKGIVKLYMTHYPLSPTCARGLRKGAYIQAVNIHEIDSNVTVVIRSSKELHYKKCFGACLRSTVSIISTASEQLGEFEVNANIIGTSFFASYAFKHVRQSYRELEWMSQCRKQLSVCNAGDRVVESTLRRLFVNLSGQAGAIKGRDPYKEFFDHACELVTEEDENRSSSFCPCDPFVQSSLPLVLGLSSLRMECIRLARSVISQTCHIFTAKNDITNRAREGCTAAIHFSREKLINKLGLPSTTLLYIGGLVDSITRSGAISRVRDKHCQMTFTPYFENMQHCHNASNGIGDFVLVNLHKIIASFIYLGRCKSSNQQQATTDLPAIGSKSGSQLYGPTSILRIGCHHFAISLQLVYNEDGISSPKGISKAQMEPTHESIDPSVGKDEASIKVYGRLSRQRWRIRKSPKEYLGCQITLGTISSSFYSDPCHLPQTVDVNLKIPLVTCSLELLRQACEGISDRIIEMALAWQYASETNSSPIVAGGWDELCCSQYSNERSEIHVAVPVHSGNSIAVDIGSLDVKFIEHRCSREYLAPFKTLFNANDLSYLGGRKTYPGSIDRRLKRRIIYRRENREVSGEAIISPSIITGVIDVSLAFLLFMKSFNHLEESFLKSAVKIKRGHIAKVRFCRARAECSRCYSTLRRRTKQTRDASFWNIPLPIDKITAVNKSSYLRAGEKKKNLICPNECDESYGYIKWELSGTLQDSTGSVRVYSERETSLMILGSGLDINAIEEGAWSSADGINYQIGLPLPKELKAQIERSKSDRKGCYQDFEAKLSKESRARYKLHLHCKTSNEPYRRMDFLCRCKILKKDANTLKPFEIPLVSSLGEERVVMQTHDMSTSGIGLELRIVDCYRNYEESKDTGWSIINALKGEVSHA